MNAPTSAPVASAPKIAGLAEAVEALRGGLATNSVGAASVEFYEAALEAAGIDADSLSFAESVEVTRRLYAISADFRRDRADAAKIEREAKREAERAKREAEKKARLVAEAEALRAKLAKLEGK